MFDLDMFYMNILLVCVGLIRQFQQHVDLISSLEVFERNERTLILSGSDDCSVQLADIEGNAIGCFGQVKMICIKYWEKNLFSVVNFLM